MPWLETDPVKEGKRFVLEAGGGLFSHTELRLAILLRDLHVWPQREM